MVVAPALRTDLERHVEHVAQVAGMEPCDVRHRLTKPGVTLLRLSRDEAAAQASAAALVSAGYPAYCVTESRLKALEKPRRAVGVERDGDDLALMDRRGEAILRVDSSSRLLLVVADLDGRFDPGGTAGIQSSPARRMLATGRGRPVLRIFDQQGRGAYVFGQRFNYKTLGETAGVSAAINFRRLLRLLQDRAAETLVELQYGMADVPPLAVVPLVGEGLDLEQLEAHARVCLVLWQEGLLGEQPAGEDSEDGPAPRVVEKPAIKPLSQAEMELLADRSRYPGWLGVWVRRSAVLGPATLVVPLVISSLALAIVGLYQPPVLALLGLPVGLLGLVMSHTSWRRKRQVEDFPTSRVRSMAMGKVELIGRAVNRLPLKTPFSMADCVYFRAEMHHLQRTAKGAQKWVRIRSITSGELPFYLEDDTGRVLVDPVGATFDLRNRKTFSNLPMQVGGARLFSAGQRDVRYMEEYIATGSRVYVMGTAAPLRRQGGDRSELRERLRRLKSDGERMKAFDLDGDGHIDEQEWSLAVQAVEDELLRDRLRSSDEEEKVLVGRGPRGSLFVVSDHSEEGLIRVLTWRQWGAGVLGLALLVVGLWGTLELLTLL